MTTVQFEMLAQQLRKMSQAARESADPRSLSQFSMGLYSFPDLDKKHLRRLTRVRDLLLEHIRSTKPLAEFNMSNWGQDVTENENGEMCGTSACAAGLAAMDPEIRSEGFTLQPTLANGEPDGYFYPEYQGYKAVQACYQFFGISRPFTPMSYAGRPNVDHLDYKIQPVDVVLAIERVLAYAYIRDIIPGDDWAIEMDASPSCPEFDKLIRLFASREIF